VGKHLHLLRHRLISLYLYTHTHKHEYKLEIDERELYVERQEALLPSQRSFTNQNYYYYPILPMPLPYLSMLTWAKLIPTFPTLLPSPLPLWTRLFTYQLTNQSIHTHTNAHVSKLHLRIMDSTFFKKKAICYRTVYFHFKYSCQN